MDKSTPKTQRSRDCGKRIPYSLIQKYPAFAQIREVFTKGFPFIPERHSSSLSHFSPNKKTLRPRACVSLSYSAKKLCVSAWGSAT
jgi:hypothetical protein